MTHLHPDHYDPETLRKIVAQGGRVYCHDAISDRVQADGLPAVGVALEEALQLGPFEVRPVPAQDWLGHDQVSWIVSCDGRRLFMAEILSGAVTGGASHAGTARSTSHSCRSTA